MYSIRPAESDVRGTLLVARFDRWLQLLRCGFKFATSAAMVAAEGPAEKNDHIFGCGCEKLRPKVHSDVLPLQLGAVITRLDATDNEALNYAIREGLSTGPLKGPAERAQLAEKQLRRQLGQQSLIELVTKAISGGVPVSRVSRTHFSKPLGRNPVTAKAMATSVENASTCRGLLRELNRMQPDLDAAVREGDNAKARGVQDAIEACRNRILYLKKQTKSGFAAGEAQAQEFEKEHASIKALRKQQQDKLRACEWAAADKLEEKVKAAEDVSRVLLTQMHPEDADPREAVIALIVESARADQHEQDNRRWSLDVTRVQDGELIGVVSLEAGCTKDWTFVEWPSSVGGEDLAQRMQWHMQPRAKGLAARLKTQRAADTALCYDIRAGDDSMADEVQRQQDEDEPRMPFGPYKGTKLKELDDSYVRFLALSEGYFAEHSNHPHPPVGAPPNVGGPAHLKLREQLASSGRLKFTTTRDGRQIPVRHALVSAAGPRLIPPPLQSSAPAQQNKSKKNKTTKNMSRSRPANLSARAWEAASPWVGGSGRTADLYDGGKPQRQSVAGKAAPERRGGTAPLTSAQLDAYRRQTSTMVHPRRTSGRQKGKGGGSRRAWDDMFVRM